jgi:tetratricopeptide (TPR) repeat protein
MRVSEIYRCVLLAVIAGASLHAISCKSKGGEATPQPATQTAAQAVAQADQFYAGREDLVHVRQGIIALREARIADPANYDLAWRLAKFNYYLGTHTDNEDERKKAFREGIEAGQTAVKLQDGKPDGHFWLGATYGGAAQSSTLAGLSTVDDIRKEMERVIQMNEGYQDGSAHMVLGLLYLQSPALLGGDPQKAVDELEKGLRFGSGNAFLRLHLAEAYLKAGRPAEARQQLNAIVAMTPDQNYLPEYKEAVAQAHKLLEQIA